jgi:hypothetical protein
VLNAPLAGQLAIVPPEQIMAYMDFATVWLDR